MAEQRQKDILQHVLGGLRAEAEGTHIAAQPAATLVEQQQNLILEGPGRRRVVRPEDSQGEAAR